MLKWICSKRASELQTQLIVSKSNIYWFVVFTNCQIQLLTLVEHDLNKV